MDQKFTLDEAASSNLSFQAAQEQRAKEGTAIPELTDPRLVESNNLHDSLYTDHLYNTAAARVASVPGLRFETFEDYLDQVDKYLDKMKAFRPLTFN